MSVNAEMAVIAKAMAIVVPPVQPMFFEMSSMGNPTTAAARKGPSINPANPPVAAARPAPPRNFRKMEYWCPHRAPAAAMTDANWAQIKDGIGDQDRQESLEDVNDCNKDANARIDLPENIRGSGILGSQLTHVNAGNGAGHDDRSGKRANQIRADKDAQPLPTHLPSVISSVRASLGWVTRALLARPTLSIRVAHGRFQGWSKIAARSE